MEEPAHLNPNNFFQSVFSNSSHDQFYYGLYAKEPRVPFLFQKYSARGFFSSFSFKHQIKYINGINIKYQSNQKLIHRNYAKTKIAQIIRK